MMNCKYPVVAKLIEYNQSHKPHAFRLGLSFNAIAYMLEVFLLLVMLVLSGFLAGYYFLVFMWAFASFVKWLKERKNANDFNDRFWPKTNIRFMCEKRPIYYLKLAPK